MAQENKKRLRPTALSPPHVVDTAPFLRYNSTHDNFCSLISKTGVEQNTLNQPIHPLLQVEQTTLANGLGIWCKERTGSGSVVLRLVVRVGARHESEGQNGIAHFLEHLIFDGTPRWQEKEIRQVIERMGGSFNGYTGHEGTIYEVEVLAEHLDLALDWLAEIVFRSSLSEEQVRKEKGVIFQERGGRMGAFFSWLEDLASQLHVEYDLSKSLMEQLFPGAALEREVTGSERTLQRIGRADLLAFYRRFYVPNNMILIVVGDVSAPVVFDRVAHWFGGFAAGPTPPSLPRPQATPQGFVQVRTQWPDWIDRAYLWYGARTVGHNHPDQAAIVVLSWILGDRLREEMRERRGLVYWLGAANNTMTDVGYFSIETDADGHNVAAILDYIEQVIAEVKRGQLHTTDLDYAKRAIRGRNLLAMDSNDRLAEVYTGPALTLRPNESLPDFFAQIEAVTLADLQRVASAYFTPENSYLALSRPAFTLRDAAIGVGGALLALAPIALTRRKRR